MRLNWLSSIIAVSASALVLFTLLAWAPVPATAGQDTAWTRTREPVIVSGGVLAAFEGAALDDLFVYAYRTGVWQQIPFQFDEVNATGAYTVENGLLDANDELAFMALDLGQQAFAWNWIPDTASQASPRYEIAVSDPLDAGQHGWVYVYRSADLAPAFSGDYVDWDAASQRLAGATYVVGFNPAVHPGIDTLELNGTAVDLLDRSKIRIGATCIIFPLTLDEEDLVGMGAMDPDIDGPVRVGGGTLASSSWAYHSLFQLRGTFDLAGIQPPAPCTSLTINSIRLSTDWRDPTTTGMAPAKYYDANKPAGVAIDGALDSVPTTPVSRWKQVSGARGSVVMVVDVALGSGTLANYYLDSSAVDGSDTGDGRSYGDAGYTATDPRGLVTVDSRTFVLDPLAPNVGSTYEDYLDNPLQAAAVAQTYMLPPPLYYVYLPIVIK